MAIDPEPVRAPALTGLAWLNVAAPLTWRDLRGKLVLLDFWTSSCINCQHVLAELRAIETQFAGKPLVVIGVHSAKFADEQSVMHVREAIGRLGIHHPVVVDDQHHLWDAYTIRGWPTLVLVDHRGYILGQLAGEGHGQQLAAVIDQALAALRAEGQLNDKPLPIRLDPATKATTPLRYPGKLLVDAPHDRLYIADSGYHRVVVTRLDGTFVAAIGTGTAGAEDGTATAASFCDPQGLALNEDRLYVADTGNHLIRAIALTDYHVTTIAGTRSQNQQRAPHGPALTTSLNSPWDLALDGEILWIAMAGQHQLWTLDLADGTIGTAAGSGAEARYDGPARSAAFAQPSGLAFDGATRKLYIADSESSCIRMVDLAAEPPQVTTLAGGDLFDFGLRDGVGDGARLQHPLGIAISADLLYIADTYNHAIRRLDPLSKAMRTVAGFSETGLIDGRGRDARFSEPGGISATVQTLYIADTNNHAIRVIDRQTGTTTTLSLNGVCAPGFCLP